MGIMLSLKYIKPDIYVKYACPENTTAVEKIYWQDCRFNHVNDKNVLLFVQL